jgi:hypothetical protein
MVGDVVTRLQRVGMRREKAQEREPPIECTNLIEHVVYWLRHALQHPVLRALVIIEPLKLSHLDPPRYI